MRRIYLFPCRTQKSSFLTPRVVGGSPPARVGRCHAKWGISSVGRASALQAGGHRFEPCILHSKIFSLVLWSSWLGRLPVTQEITSSSLVRTVNGSVAQSVEQWIEAPCVGSSILSRAIHNLIPLLCGCSLVVKPQPSKLLSRVRFSSPALNFCSFLPSFLTWARSSGG